MTLNIISLSIATSRVMLCNAGGHYTERHYAEYHYVDVVSPFLLHAICILVTQVKSLTAQAQNQSPIVRNE
jgi:hypothetical protein